jgi:molybdate transport system ATP-binding protein
MITIDTSKYLLTSHGPLTLTVRLTIERHNFYSFFGPSGTGKTTTLRMIAGLTDPDSGEIRVHGKTWFDSVKKVNLPPRKRNIGFVFQDYALFPTMTVRKNIEYAAGRNNEKVGEVIDLMGLRSFETVLPEKLSGGQRQRVALARALVRSPDILLLDEPLSALDHEMRNTLQDEIRKIHDLFGLTSIIVTHDIAEIYKMSNAVAVFDNGKILRRGSPEMIFGRNLSTKFRVVGKIIDLHASDVAAVVTVQVGGNQTKVVVDIDEYRQYSIGQDVIVAAKAFTPVLLPLT